MTTSYSTGQLTINGSVQGTSITDGTNVLSDKIGEFPVSFNLDMRITGQAATSFTLNFLAVKTGSNMVTGSWKFVSFSWNGFSVTSGTTYQSQTAITSVFWPKTNNVHIPYRLQRNGVWIWGDMVITTSGFVQLYVDITNATTWEYSVIGTNSFIVDAGSDSWNYEP